MQRPIEQRHGAPIAILISSLFFTAVHMTKAWALLGMVPIVLGAGVLLGLLAWSSRSLIPGIIGHVVMDVGLIWSDRVNPAILWFCFCRCFCFSRTERAAAWAGLSDD